MSISEGDKRNSSIELLRIILIVFIIFHHYCYHGLEESADFSLQTIDIGKRILIQLFHSGGIIANNAFALISGYYLSATGGVPERVK